MENVLNSRNLDSWSIIVVNPMDPDPTAKRVKIPLKNSRFIKSQADDLVSDQELDYEAQLSIACPI